MAGGRAIYDHPPRRDRRPRSSDSYKAPKSQSGQTIRSRLSSSRWTSYQTRHASEYTRNDRSTIFEFGRDAKEPLIGKRCGTLICGLPSLLKPIDKASESKNISPRDYPLVQSGGLGCFLANLGTPDATDDWLMRRYLKEFLSDPRVIEVHCIAWWMSPSQFDRSVI